MISAYSAKVDILCRGYSGYNTRLAKRLSQLLFLESSYPPSLITLFWGANDASWEGTCQYIPLDEFKDNLRAIIDHIQSVYKDTKILLITPPPIAQDAYNIAFPDTLRTNENTKKYAHVVLDLAEEYKLVSLDLWTQMSNSTNWEELFTDGLHLSSKGNEFVFKALVKTIKHHFKELSPYDMPYEFYHWSKAVYMDPFEALPDPS